jgi:hypothetical protein
MVVQGGRRYKAAPSSTRNKSGIFLLKIVAPLSEEANFSRI